MQIDNGLLHLADRIHSLGLNIWCYTGYTIEEIEANDSLRRIFDAVDVIVEGRYVSALRDIHLPFRGSSNQRIVESKPVKYQSVFLIFIIETSLFFLFLTNFHYFCGIPNT